MILLSFLFVVSIYGVSCAPPTSGTEVKIRCAAPYKMSRNLTELSYFVKHGEFPAGKESLKCYWECFVAEMDMVDLNFNPVEEKLRALAEWFSKDAAVQVLVSEKFLENCLQVEDTLDHCDKAYSIMKCYSDVKNGRNPKSEEHFPVHSSQSSIHHERMGKWFQHLVAVFF